MAYFYCNRAEESRRDPESILRTLIQQLAQTPSEDELLTPVLDIYKAREKVGQLSSRLTLKECQDLLVQLLAVVGIWRDLGRSARLAGALNLAGALDLGRPEGGTFKLIHS